MTKSCNPSARALIKPESPIHIVVLVCVTAILSYLAARLGGVLVLRPEMIWPLWPGCAFLVAVLLLTPRKIWMALLVAGLAGFALYDVQEHLPIRATGSLLAGDSIEILIAALGVNYVFRGAPHLNSLKSLAKYSLFAVILAPISVACLAASALETDSWWVGFFTEGLALLTVTPAILSWVRITPTRVRQRKWHYLEAVSMCIVLGIFAYLTFAASGSESRPALLYSLVPFLLWAALRFGIAGISNSMVIVAFVAIWGAVHRRGPFTVGTPVSDVLSLQLFLLVAGTSFMVLAAVVEEHKAAARGLRDLNLTLESQTTLLQSREELLKSFVKNVPAGVAMLDRNMRYLQVSDRWCADYSVKSSQVLGRSHYELFSDIPDRWKEMHRRALEGETLRADEDPWEREDGTRWARWEIRPWKTSNGSIGGIVIFAEDITQRKQMEEALSSSGRKLIEAQEQERTRIGRELHDDINQRLAMLALEIEQLQANPFEAPTRLQELRERVTEISDDVQALSHELHSSKLEYLGVISGIRSWCKEFGQRQAMEIDFTSDVTSVVPFDVGVCLFRVLQESLHNVLKHSGVKRVEVQLREVSHEIHLVVADLGRGFDIEAALQSQGLGLTSMQERVRLVSGTSTIQSKPMGGTRIHVCVPLRSEHNAQRAAG